MHCIRVIATRLVVVALRELGALAEQLEAGEEAGADRNGGQDAPA
jgi:hypothetical protein